MKEKLSRNLGLKAISAALAFVIWLMVVNISQPEVNGTQTVEIKVENADRLTAADKTYKMDTRSVRISYRVRLPQQSRISADNFHAYVDLADYSITGAVPVYVDVDDSIAGLISDISLSPMVVHVDTEDIQRKRFDLVTATNGKTMEGYMAGELSFSPGYVYVTGPVSEVGQISEVGIEVDVSEANSALSGSAPIHFYDANGNEIKLDERVSTNRETIDYELPIYRIKSLSVVAEASGTPAEGYVLEQVEANPGFVDVYGDEAVLSQYTSLRIPAAELSVNGATATVTRSFDITQYLPEGLRLAQPGTEISVAARIRKLPETAETGAVPESSSSEVLFPAESSGEAADSIEAETRASATETAADAGRHETERTGPAETAAGESGQHGTMEETAAGTGSHNGRENSAAQESMSRESTARETETASLHAGDGGESASTQNEN